MGQVLIIQNKIDGKPVNTIYYHWSAYTESSIAELDTFTNITKYTRTQYVTKTSNLSHLIWDVSFEIGFNHHHIMLLARSCHAPQELSVIVVFTARWEDRVKYQYRVES